MLTFGIEEEVFITEPEKPDLRSLYYLARLLAKNPTYYYTHSASNFARGKDLRQGIMSGVEISTSICDSADAAVDCLQKRRAELAEVVEGLIAPVGHLLNLDAPTNTCSIQIHIGGASDNRKLYNNIIHFLPILCLFTINAPFAGGNYFGQSFRIANSFAIGPIGEDWTYRFQDLILSRRLGTIELRVCDPCWDIQRIRWLARCLSAIANLEDALPPNKEFYNSIRENIAIHGILDECQHLVKELKSIIDFPEELIVDTPSNQLRDLYYSEGLIACYSALDNGYRNGIFEPREVTQTQRASILKGALGVVGYFIPRLPYYAWKGIVEQNKL